jgi:hypothetical protein
MKTIDPEHRMVQAVTDTVGTRVFGNLCDPSHTKRTQRSIVKVRGSANVGNPDSSVIDHGVSPRCFGCAAFVRFLASRGLRLDRKLIFWERHKQVSGIGFVT